MYNISVEYKLAKVPTKVKLLPENIPLLFEYDKGVLKVAVDKVEIHSAIEIDF